jgi:hypothetical protein
MRFGGNVENSKDNHREKISLRVAAISYHTIMLAAFVMGLYGLFSLFSLATAELQHSVHMLGVVP